MLPSFGLVVDAVLTVAGEFVGPNPRFEVFLNLQKKKDHSVSLISEKSSSDRSAPTLHFKNFAIWKEHKVL